MTPIPFQPVQARPQRPNSPAVIPQDDPRWTLAARAVLLADPRRGLSDETRTRLTAWATSRGFPPIHAATVLSIAENAATRGGLDHTAAHELAQLPTPSPPTPANRWPVLIAINLALAGVATALLIARI